MIAKIQRGEDEGGGSDIVAASSAVRQEQTVRSIAAPVDNVDLILFGIVEKEEIVTQELHLLDGLVRVHRLDGKPLCPNQNAHALVFLQFEGYGDRLWWGIAWAGAGAPAIDALLVISPDLALHLVQDAVDGTKGVVVALFGAQNGPTGLNRHLRGDGMVVLPVMGAPQLQLRINHPSQQALEPLGASGRNVAQQISDVNVIAANQEFHRSAFLSVVTAMFVATIAAALDGARFWVPAEGLEPPTPALGRRRSLH
jgi:hypothetical protein